MTVIQAGTAVYWYSLATAMVFAFAGLALVRHHFPAAGNPKFLGVVAG